MHTITIDVKDKVLDNVLYLLKNLSDIEIIENKDKTTKVNQENDRWIYWKDAELDNFGKIAIGLSKHNYDNEDYSKW